MSDERLAEIRAMVSWNEAQVGPTMLGELLAEVTRLRASLGGRDTARDAALIDEANLRGAWKWSWSQPDWATLSPEDHFGRAIRAAGTLRAALSEQKTR